MCMLLMFMHYFIDCAIYVHLLIVMLLMFMHYFIDCAIYVHLLIVVC